MEDKHNRPSATMKDVAEHAGVSTATVSRALMNPEKVSAVTRQKVEQAMLVMEYFPNMLTRNTKRSESHMVLVVVPDICNPFFADVIQGIEETATTHGYFVLLGDCAHQGLQGKALINLVVTKQIDGILLLGSSIPFDVSKEGQRNLPPIVMANEFTPELDLPTVHIDNLTAAFKAVLYLHELGHYRIACIAGSENISLSHYRLKGYIQALRRNGIAEEKSYVVRGDFSYQSGAQALGTLMALPQPPTAIFCHNDVMAMGALSQAKRMGLRVPDDLSLVGFDDIKQAQYSDPPLTTVSQPRYQIGKEAMLLLLEQLQHRAIAAGSHLLESEFIVRGSTCVPKR